MHRNTKIAACNYCGTRAALVLSGELHVLICSSCGAPLSELKSMSAEASGAATLSRSFPTAAAFPIRPLEPRRKKKKPKKRKPKLKGIFKEILDEIEDVFD